MRHLSHAELVDLTEGVLPAERAAHIDECARCRAESDALRRVMTEVNLVDMPEPSPLFWQHLSAQIREALDHEPQPNRVHPAHLWWGTGWRRLPAAIALTVVIAIGLWWLAASRSSVPVGTSTAPPRVAHGESRPAPERIEATSPDVGWELVLAVADQDAALDPESLGVEVAPGAAERAVLSLSADEQQELVRLLDEAIARGPEPATGPT